MPKSTIQRYSAEVLPFEQLSVFTLYELLALRQQVFVVEQGCNYQDCDGKDPACLHLLVRNEHKQLVAYSRLLPKGVAYADFVSIGRVLSAPSVRSTGVGKFLIQQSIEAVWAHFGRQPIKIGAQTYLLRFYESFGFCSTGEEYLEDNIPHTSMILW